MKATVLEIKNGFAALLQEDGTIVKMRNRNYMIGEVIKMKEKTTRKRVKISAIAAAAAIFVMLMGVGIYAYATPSYYVSVDVNPGITMEVNMFENVIGMEAANEEAEEILAGLDLKNKNIEDAVSQAIERITEMGYLDGEDGNVLIATTSKNEEKSERLAGKLKNAAEDKIAENGVKAEVSAGVIGYEMVQAAKEIEGMTPGKYNIIVNLLGKDANEYSAIPIKDIMKEYTALKGTEGKARAEQAKENNGTPAENSELKEQNAVGKPEEAGAQEGKAPVDNPATDKKAPNANEMQDNAKGEKPENTVVPETSEKPETPATPEAPGKPETPATPETPAKP